MPINSGLFPRMRLARFGPASFRHAPKYASPLCLSGPPLGLKRLNLVLFCCSLLERSTEMVLRLFAALRFSAFVLIPVALGPAASAQECSLKQLASLDMIETRANAV